VLEALFGNRNVERVLFFLLKQGEGYPRAIAQNFGETLSAVQKQLKRLEDGGVVISRLVGRTRLYQISPRYPFKKELEAFLEKAFEAVPKEQVRKFYTRRSRPRRVGKRGLSRAPK
jgi:DNA-binding transcriptional ArsR family regulator